MGRISFPIDHDEARAPGIRVNPSKENPDNPPGAEIALLGFPMVGALLFSGSRAARVDPSHVSSARLFIGPGDMRLFKAPIRESHLLSRLCVGLLPTPLDDVIRLLAADVAARPPSISQPEGRCEHDLQ